MSEDVQLYRASVEILVADSAQRFLTVTNRRWGGFSLPGGKVALGELRIDAARRELKEEAGIEPCRVYEFAGGVSFAKPEDGGPPWFCTAFVSELNGQTPRNVEDGTTVGWHSARELVEDSIYPDWYHYLFGRMGLRGV